MQKREYILMICLVIGLMVLMPFRFQSAPEIAPVMRTLPEPQLEPEPLQEQVKEPQIEEYWIDTSGAWGRVFVTVERGEANVESFGYEPACPIKLSIWSSDSAAAPLQTLDFVGGRFCGPQVVDANFDGYFDFMFLCSQEQSGSAYKGAEYYHLWLWNREENRFENVSEFVQIPNPELESKAQQVTGERFLLNGCGEFAAYQWYQYSPFELLRERYIEITEASGGRQLTVSGRDGEILFQETYTKEQDIAGVLWEEKKKWENPDYRGEIYGQPIDETHDAFLIDTQGEKGTLLVTVEWVEGHTGIDAAARLDFSVWDPAELTAPIQTMEAFSDYFHQETVWDVNFDGYPDFSYLAFSGSHGNDLYNTWRWDEAEGKFVEVSEFLDLYIYRPELDAERKLVKGSMSSLRDPSTTFYRWVDGELTPLRHIAWDLLANGDWGFYVDDYFDGAWKAAYSVEIPFEEKGQFPVGAWYDPDYHGPS